MPFRATRHSLKIQHVDLDADLPPESRSQYSGSATLFEIGEEGHWQGEIHLVAGAGSAARAQGALVKALRDALARLEG